jgi:hypothetical protein
MQVQDKRLRFRDAVRLLEKRRTFESEVSDPAHYLSISAYLSWRAFIIVSRGTCDGSSETEKTQQLIVRAFLDHPGLQRYLIPFAKAIREIARASDITMREWYCDPDLPGDVQSRRVEDARRRIKRIVHDVLGDGTLSINTCYDIGQDIYAIRSAVIAHASITTGGNLFDATVESFADVVAIASCAGIADRSKLPVDEVMRIVHVG